MTTYSYTYSITEFNTSTMLMKVVYQSPGKADHTAIMPIEKFPEMTLEQSVDAQVKSAIPIGLWDAQDQQATQEEVDAILAKTNVSDSVTILGDTRTDEQKALDKIAGDRASKEAEGVTWVDTATSETIYLDTTAQSQSRFSAATTGIANNLRTDPSKWKCAKVTANGPVLFFRDTTNAELLVWAGLVLNHVQKCFDAEAAAANKVLAGDLAADFATEFAAL